MQFRGSRFFYAAVIVTLLNLAYWCAYQVNAYNTFHAGGFDIGLMVLSLHNFFNPIANMNPLQYLIFQNHASLDQFLILPLWYLFPTALTLLLIKAVTASLTGLLLFFIIRRITKNEPFAFAMLVALFLNFGFVSFELFEYHVETFIIPFYLLTFYFYIKVNRKLFFVSLFLLLNTLESIIPLTMAFGAGMMLYEYFYNKEFPQARERRQMALSVIIGALIALVLYNAVWFNLYSYYQSSGISPDLQFFTFPLVPIISGIGNPNITSIGSFAPPNVAVYLLIVFMVAIGGFGALALFYPRLSLILLLPWLLGLFLYRNIVFLFAWRYTYALAPAVVLAIFGFHAASSRYPDFARHIWKFVLLSAVLFSFPILPTLLQSAALAPASETVFFHTNASLQASYSIVRYMMTQIPENASVMSQGNFYPYLANRNRFEKPDNFSYYFHPDYIIIDWNLTYGQFFEQSEQDFLAKYLASHNYSLLAVGNGAFLYKSAMQYNQST